MCTSSCAIIIVPSLKLTVNLTFDIKLSDLILSNSQMSLILIQIIYLIVN